MTVVSFALIIFHIVLFCVVQLLLFKVRVTVLNYGDSIAGVKTSL